MNDQTEISPSVQKKHKMTWVISLLLGGLISEAVGFVLIRKGFEHSSSFHAFFSSTAVSHLVKTIITSPAILSGTAFEAVHFGFLLELLSLSDVSFIIPLTSLGYILTPIFANAFLHEAIPPLRWTGITLICAGVVVIMRKS
ncbi:MAG: EamA family transporter [Nitrospiraceae bacterium]|nr:EamA family transporter [Nitrospiraceae bacterium]